VYFDIIDQALLGGEAAHEVADFETQDTGHREDAQVMFYI
jgi:hypothetical protein